MHYLPHLHFLCQVLWVGKEDICATWVHANSLPINIIEEFEKGIQSEVKVQATTQGGQTSFTAEVEQMHVQAQTPAKRMKPDRWVTPNSSG